MATFVYKARRLDGTAVEGSLPAENERAALVALDKMGLFPLHLRTAEQRGAAAKSTAVATAAPAAEGAEADPPAGLGAALTGLLGARRRIGAETAARFARELADLTQAGVPILKALDAVAEDPDEDAKVIWGAREGRDDAAARIALQDVRRDVAQGAALAQALERRPELFGPSSVSIIRAGEAGGFLDAALRRVAVFSERERALARKVKGALTYPALLTTVSAGAVAFLLTWVIPRFAVIYEDLGGALPLPTRILMVVGDVLSGWWWAILAGLGLVGFGLLRYLATPEGRLARDRLLLRVPLVRAVVAYACLARFSRTLGTLLGSGVPILEALAIAKDAAGNLEFTARLADTIAPMREGAALVQPLAKTRLFPPQVLEMVAVGQDTGTLVEVLERVGDRADEEVDQALRIFVTAFEPALIVTVAGVVFFVVLAALLPVFTLNTLIQ